MRRIIPFFILFFCLSGCSYFSIHQMDIEQGNRVTQEMVNKIHPGMTENQVKDVLGNPVLAHMFDANRIDYVYTIKTGNQKATEKYITIIFQNGNVRDITGNMYSPFMK